jgi:hypothetical protein
MKTADQQMFSADCNAGVAEAPVKGLVRWSAERAVRTRKIHTWIAPGGIGFRGRSILGNLRGAYTPQPAEAISWWRPLWTRWRVAQSPS